MLLWDTVPLQTPWSPSSYTLSTPFFPRTAVLNRSAVCRLWWLILSVNPWLDLKELSKQPCVCICVFNVVTKVQGNVTLNAYGTIPWAGIQDCPKRKKQAENQNLFFSASWLKTQQSTCLELLQRPLPWHDRGPLRFEAQGEPSFLKLLCWHFITTTRKLTSQGAK